MIGVPHPDFGEAVVAIIVAEAGSVSSTDTIIDLCKDKLANFKVSKHVEFINALPRNTMSKVQKKALRDQLGNLFTS